MICLVNATKVVERLHDERPVLCLITDVSCKVEDLSCMCVETKVQKETAKQADSLKSHVMVDKCLRDLTQVIAWSDRIEDSLLLEDEQNVD